MFVSNNGDKRREATRSPHNTPARDKFLKSAKDDIGPLATTNATLNFPLSASASAGGSAFPGNESLPIPPVLGDFDMEDKSLGKGEAGDYKGDLSSAVAAALAEQKDEFTKGIKDAVGEHAANMVNTTFAKVAGHMEKKIDGVEIKVDDLSTKFENLCKETKDLQAEMLEKINALTNANARSVNGSSIPSFSQPSSSPPQPPHAGTFSDGSGVGILLGSGGFFRPVDPTKLFVNTLEGVQVSGEKFGEVFRKLATESGLRNLEGISISGGELDSRFEITFDCAPAAKQFLGSLYLGKDPNGAPKFKEQVVEGPNGNVQFFINPDKNNAQVRKEVLCKKLAGFLQGFLPANIAISASRVNGRVFVAKKKTVSILIKDENSFTLVWDKAYCNVIKLEYPAVEQAFQSEVAQSSS